MRHLIALYHRWFIQQSSNRLEKLVAYRKHVLFGDITGTVLEIGPGTGVNFAYIPRNVTYIGVEPNIRFHLALENHPQRPFKMSLFTPRDETYLPVDSGSVDYVICSFVLCSVGNPEVMLQEIQRVLKPCGTFIFIEHIAAPQYSMLWMLQHLFTWVTCMCAGNCHANRNTWKLISSGGFASTRIRDFKLPTRLIGKLYPCIQGSATKVR